MKKRTSQPLSNFYMLKRWGQISRVEYLALQNLSAHTHSPIEFPYSFPADGPRELKKNLSAN